MFTTSTQSVVSPLDSISLIATSGITHEFVAPGVGVREHECADAVRAASEGGRDEVAVDRGVAVPRQSVVDQRAGCVVEADAVGAADADRVAERRFGSVDDADRALFDDEELTGGDERSRHGTASGDRRSCRGSRSRRCRVLHLPGLWNSTQSAGCESTSLITMEPATGATVQSFVAPGVTAVACAQSPVPSGQRAHTASGAVFSYA